MMTAGRRRQEQRQRRSSSHLVLLLLSVTLLLLLLLSHSADAAFARPSLKHRSPRSTSTFTTSTTTSTTTLFYEPKWKKKKTLADELGGVDGKKQQRPQDVGIKGNIKVVFQQGNATKTTMAFVGQPVRDVATQAGQFIKYGCGKGECGTCECLVNGKWIRPCQALVPADVANNQEEPYVIQVKQVQAQSKSSGKFYSLRSFIMGFYNNLLGMVGFVKYRRAAKQNWQERQEYEDLIKQRTLEKKKRRRREAEQAQAQQQSGSSSLKP